MMKKMPYAIIFIIILALLVFAGCKTLVDTPSESDNSGESSSDAEESSSNDIFEGLTDENGNPIFSEEELSSLQEEYSSIYNELSSSAAEEDKSSSEAPSSEAPSSETPSQTTTAPADETSTSAPEPGVNDYDILRSGKFYMDGTMYADGESNPITLAVGDNLVYMQATMDGASMGFLISGGSTYLLNPAEKTYCEFGSLLSGILSQAGMMSQEEIMEYINEMGFSSMDDLSSADEKNSASLNGKACTVYIFNKSDGTKVRVFMDNNRLLGFEIVSIDGVVDSATYINSISADIPVLPPQNYTKQNILTFMTSMESLFDD
ncbi:MAG: hypothetical protein J1E34_08260 [Oscillospiraceae bacterium]|nr:hypothetical protein [Oscillospiraceae bacterium]